MSEQKAEYKIEGRPATIFRVVHDKDNPYVTINTTAINNPKLSFKAKGILAYLMSRPDGWEVSVADLVNRSTDGGASIRSGLKELRDAGHMRQFASREAGKFTGWHIEVYELPQDGPINVVISDETIDETEPPDSDNRKVVTPTGGMSPDSDFPQVGKPQVDKPQVGNRGQVLSTLSSNELNNARAPLSKENFEKANKKVDALLRQERTAQEKQASGASWPGRETMPEPIRNLLDVYVQLTGQRPAKKNLLDWLQTGGDWLEAGISADDLRAAYKKSKPDNGEGFMVSRPGSLTTVAGMFAGERRKQTDPQTGGRVLISTPPVRKNDFVSVDLNRPILPQLEKANR